MWVQGRSLSCWSVDAPLFSRAPFLCEFFNQQPLAALPETGGSPTRETGHWTRYVCAMRGEPKACSQLLSDPGLVSLQLDDRAERALSRGFGKHLYGSAKLEDWRDKKHM